MPNMMAANLRRKKSNTIGVIVPRISRHFFSSTIAGIEEVAYKAGFNVMICQSLEALQRERNIIRNLMANRVEGILMSISMQTTEGTHISECIESGIPVIFFDRHIDGVNGAGQVLLDDFKGGFMATEHLIKKGCKKIAHFTAAPHIAIYKNRHAGYRSALKKYGLPYEKDLVLESELFKEDGERLAEKLLTKFKDVDGIFSANDFAALGALKYLKNKGIEIPGRIALVGFSNEPTSEVIEPSLTTLDQSGNEIGRLACKQILEYIEKGVPNTSKGRIMITPRLIERNSTKIGSEKHLDHQIKSNTNN